MRISRKSAAALLLAAAFSAFACSGKGANVFPKAPVVVISIDTLRADHLPAYGYRGVATPALDALAKDGVVFENAVAQAPLTLPSHATIFTGLLPFQHGVRDNSGYRLKGRATLASFLRARGYSTGGAVSAVVLDHGSGIAEGFDFWEDGVESRDASETLGRVQRAGLETERLLEEWLAGLPAGKPFFAFLHLYEPHTPYEPPEPFRSRYAAMAYDGEIAAADAVAALLIAYLKNRALYDPALIVLLSDHGEGLGDHGEDEHGILLYRETTRVPLFIKMPGQSGAGRREKATAALADVFPTVAGLLGERPPDGLAGRALLSKDAGDAGAARRVYSETLYPRFHFGWSDLSSLTDSSYQYIEAPRPELYDWQKDPGEKNDLSRDLPPAFRSMRAELSGMDRPLQAPGETDPETLRKLASLGYISPSRSNTAEKNLPDPKDRLPTLDLLKLSSRLVSEHREDEAIAKLRRLTEENPRMLDAWETLARVCRRSGRPREALAALEAADRLSPATPQILLGLADLHRELSQFDKARSLALAAGEAGASGHHDVLASIALDKGDLDTARAEATLAQGKSKTARAPLVLLARVAVQGGNLPEALASTDRALWLQREWKQLPLISLQATRGDILARMGREKEAEEAFQTEIRDFPDNLEGWSRLALLRASGGRPKEFRETILEMTRRAPTPAGFEAAARVCETVGDAAGARFWRQRKAGRPPAALGRPSS